MKIMDLQEQRDLVKSHPPFIFPLQAPAPKYCYQISSAWWASFEFLLKNNDKNLQDSLGPINNKTINDSNPATFIYISETLWKTLRSLYGCKYKQKIFIINNHPAKPTIFSRVILNSQVEKIILVPKSLTVKRFIKLIAKKLKINQNDYVFQNIIGDGYRCDMNEPHKTLEQISFCFHSLVAVKSKNSFGVPEILIREVEGEDDEFQQVLKESTNENPGFHKELNDSHRFRDNSFSDINDLKIREVKRLTFLAFEPKVMLEIKSLKKIRRELEGIEKILNGK